MAVQDESTETAFVFEALRPFGVVLSVKLYRLQLSPPLDVPTLPYDLWVIAILSFIWLTPPDWLRDPTATGLGVWDWF